MKQLIFSDKKLLQVFTGFNDLVKSIEDPDLQKSLRTLMDDLGERFFTAPASGRLEYHNCMPGGLVEHSLRVYSIFRNLSSSYGKDFSEDDMKVAALFHDFGKVGSLTKPYFVLKNSEWHKDKMGLYYEHNPELSFMPHAQRSLQTLAHYEVPLEDHTSLGILIHDGQYVQENKPYAMNEGKFALLLSMADRLACEIEKEKWQEIQ